MSVPRCKRTGGRSPLGLTLASGRIINVHGELVRRTPIIVLSKDIEQCPLLIFLVFVEI